MLTVQVTPQKLNPIREDVKKMCKRACNVTRVRYDEAVIQPLGRQHLQQGRIQIVHTRSGPLNSSFNFVLMRRNVTVVAAVPRPSLLPPRQDPPGHGGALASPADVHHHQLDAAGQVEGTHRGVPGIQTVMSEDTGAQSGGESERQGHP